MNTRSDHLRSLAARIRASFPTGPRLHLRFGGCTVEVQTNTADITAALKRYFRPFAVAAEKADITVSVHESPEYRLPLEYTLKPPDPGKTRPKEEYVDLEDGRIVRKLLTGLVFVFGGGENIAVGPCRDNLNQIVNFINNRYIEWMLCRGCLLGHAAGVILNGRGIAVAGFSGAGKSTLALHLMNEGATFVSNDRLMIEKRKNGLIMHGVAKMPRINPGTALNNPNLSKIITAEERNRFASLPEDELWQLEHKYDALIEDCYGPDRFVLHAPMEGLVILNWKRNGGPTELRPADPALRRELLPAFMKNVGLFFLPAAACRMPEPNEETYIEFLSRCRVLEISGGIDFTAAVNACLQLVGTEPVVV